MKDPVEHLRWSFLGKWLTAFWCLLLLQKSSLADAWLGSKYASAYCFKVWIMIVLTLHKKWSFPFTKEILHGKLHFLYSVITAICPCYEVLTIHDINELNIACRLAKIDLPQASNSVIIIQQTVMVTLTADLKRYHNLNLNTLNYAAPW